ncbi:ATP-binding domain-containing protein [uncultured archaeon]|nr:ATP-binding domain-containing protein [uncultured archaeon]
MPKAALSWSSGKDSAFALYRVLQSGKYDIVTLLTTVTTSYDRVSIHGVREELLAMQAENTGLPVMKVEIPPKSSNADYERAMAEAVQKLNHMGVEYIIFGDIFLEDVKRYREDRMAGTGITPVFPNWGEDTGKMARDIVNAGIGARIVCLDPKKLDRRFGGAEFDLEFLGSLPPDVDPCGERGEFHTFVYRAPFFAKSLGVKTGEIVERDGFLFTDLYIP